MLTIESILEKFHSVSLDEVSGVKLMNRIDRKFWFDASQLEYMLDQLNPMYDVLEVNGKRLVEYQTIYFDTENNQMYLHHHNGFRDRYKVRRRKYETSDNGFLEIKRKTNKERTIKVRIEVPFHEGAMSEEETHFLRKCTPYQKLYTEPVLFNKFSRISLINKNKTERCTIDIKLKIRSHQEEIYLDDLVILELKRGSLHQPSPLIDLMKKLHIRQKGLSKYCTGRALLEPELKYNRFKPRLMHLENRIIKNHLLCLSY